MTRRSLFTLLALQSEVNFPTEDGPLNRFADRYNAYVGELRKPVMDIRKLDKLWKSVLQAWDVVNRSH